MNTPMPLPRRDRILSPLIGLVLVTLAGTPVHSAVVSDFEDGVPDWDQQVLRGVTFSESDGRLVASGTIPARNYCMTANLSSLRWYESAALREGEVLVLRVDLLESSPNDVQALLTYVTPNTGGGGYERLPVLRVDKAVRLSWPASFPGMEVWGAPDVNGPWTIIAEPITESAGNYLMTVPSPLSETMRVFRVEQPPSP